jgi:hypothetical protein
MRVEQTSPLEKTGLLIDLWCEKHPEALQAQSALDRNLLQMIPSRFGQPQFLTSDKPFLQARYVSVTDGYCYHLYGEASDPHGLIAWRYSPWRWLFRRWPAGDAVVISPDAYLDLRLVLFAHQAPQMRVSAGELQHLGQLVFKVEPMWACRALWAHWLKRMRQLCSPGVAASGSC